MCADNFSLDGGAFYFWGSFRFVLGCFACDSIHKPLLLTFPNNSLDDALDVTSEPDEQNLAIASSSSLTQSKLSSHNPTSKFAQLEVELGGSVTLQCPQGNSGNLPNFITINKFVKLS